MQNLEKLQLAQLPYVIMAILNVTPDSFSDGGSFDTPKKAIEGAKQMIKDGANIIDIGGESTRSKAQPISLQEEIDRSLPVIEGIRQFSSIPISIDTTKAKVAKQAIHVGANIVNDISAGTTDSEMIPLLVREQSPVILMHRQGTPQTMQENPIYNDVIKEVMAFLQQQAIALEQAGFHKKNIIIDPGIGFGKTYEHNLTLLKGLNTIKSLGYEILLGVSRKSVFQKMIHASVDDRLAGTIAVNTFAYTQGVRYFRVHDVKANRQALEATRILLGK